MFAVALFSTYSLVPLILRWSSATIFNLSLLTSDVYSLLFGLFLFHYSVLRGWGVIFHLRPAN
jgi:solute carrier family 35 protein F1/2